MKTVAIIPARGGSKGLPGKSIKPLLGKPLISYTIEAAINSGCFDKNHIFVSTDDETIASIATNTGVQLPNNQLRPPHLAEDATPMGAVLNHCITALGLTDTVLVLLQPTSPLRTAKHIQEALKQWHALNNLQATLTSVHAGKPLAWQGLLSETGRWQTVATEPLPDQRQKAEIPYQLNGAIYIAHSHKLIQQQITDDPIYGYVLPQSASVDIDTLEDFELAEYYLNKQLAPKV